MTDPKDSSSENNPAEEIPVEETPVEETAGQETLETEETAATDAVSFTAETIEKGKVFAILSYLANFVGIPFCIVPLIMRDNAYSLYHGKQSTTIIIAGYILGAVSAVLTVICIGPIIGLVGYIFLMVINIMGLIQTLNGDAKPLPLIGKYAIDWFKGITVVEK